MEFIYDISVTVGALLTIGGMFTVSHRSMKKRMDSMENTMNRRFDSIDSRMESIEDTMNARFASVDSRFESLEATMNSRFESLEATMNSRFESLEATMNSRFESIEDTMNARFASVDSRFESLESTMNTWFASVDSRFSTAESALAEFRKEFRVDIRKLQDQTTKLAEHVYWTRGALEVSGILGKPSGSGYTQESTLTEDPSKEMTRV